MQVRQLLPRRAGGGGGRQRRQRRRRRKQASVVLLGGQRHDLAGLVQGRQEMVEQRLVQAWGWAGVGEGQAGRQQAEGGVSALPGDDRWQLRRTHSSSAASQQPPQLPAAAPTPPRCRSPWRSSSVGARLEVHTIVAPSSRSTSTSALSATALKGSATCTSSKHSSAATRCRPVPGASPPPAAAAASASVSPPRMSARAACRSTSALEAARVASCSAALRPCVDRISLPLQGQEQARAVMAGMLGERAAGARGAAVQAPAREPTVHRRRSADHRRLL